MTNAAELFVQCLENEGVKYIFGIPGSARLQSRRRICLYTGKYNRRNGGVYGSAIVYAPAGVAQADRG